MNQNMHLLKKGLGLGIDAGGTYTDVALFDFENNIVVGLSKALTTHDDYTIGIQNALTELFTDGKQKLKDAVQLVSLSTTLATNAIVENRGGRVGLILIGYDSYTENKIQFGPKVSIGGKHSITGELIEQIDEVEITAAVEQLLAEKVDAFALVDQVGMRNPEFELYVQEHVRKLCTIPVIGAYELTDEINSVKRATSCYFNARLIPLIISLLSSVRAVLLKFDIQAPLMVVKGDGSLMAEKIALRYPIETVLSGPAASAYGGAKLSREKSAWVVDGGGTTTDIAYIKEGFPQFQYEGVTINHFRTAMKTVDIHTFGLGGDSHIQYFHKYKKILVGPKRVIPISWLAYTHPEVISILQKKVNIQKADEIFIQPADFFIFQKMKNLPKLHPQEAEICELLKEKRLLHITDIATMVDAVSCTTLRTGQLERHGVILRAGLTPTDILHASGEINLWNRKAAREAVQLYALRAGMEEQEFITHVWDAFAYRFGAHFFYTVYEKERLVIDRKKFSKDLAALIVNQSEKMRISTYMDDPIVLIGAPAEMYRRYISAYIDGKIVVPPYHQIAGAVGAITGMVSETVIILIRPTQKGGFIAFTPLSRMYFSDLAEAKEKMVQWANSYIQERAESAGAAKPHIKVVTTDHNVDFIGRDTIYLETTITAHASGIPQV